MREVLEGKRVVVVDDSIVRGTTSRKIVKMLREAGAREVHMRISSPPTTQPLLLRHRHADARGADRVDAHGRRRSASTSAPTRSRYLSVDGLYAFTRRRARGLLRRLLHAATIPVPLDDEHRGVRQLHLFEARERPEHR